jgi:hypothetical protein
MQWGGSHLPLIAAKDSGPHPIPATRSQPGTQAFALPRTTLRPFHLATDWPMLFDRLAAASLRWLEIRLQI